jgi:hypothetical protein
MGFGGHFVHFCNGISPIGMYKYVRGEIVKMGGEYDGACKL